MAHLLKFCSSSAVVLLAVSACVAQERVQFNRDIRPLLTENCLFCHGPDKNQRKADLRLDLRQAAIDSQAFVPGKPDQSELISRIFTDDPEQLMPPAKSNKHLTPAQKELLKRWVAEGAEYQGHWSYLSPVKPSVPAGANGIDHLVQSRLSRLGMKPAPEADRRTLARRLYLDLLGLPPKPEVVDAFVNDAAPDAYARLVEQLLASPHYGERMALSWLDAVRFADTIGYHSDNPRNVFPYRDYVIRAFNTNKPFNQFTVEQLAGDLLPGSTVEQQVASGFNHLLLTTEEGGAQSKDYEARYLGDRVRAVAAVWLGQTIGCCQCHDHKFDPSTARDFYSMGAFFADIQEPIIGRRDIGIIVPSAEQAQELARKQQVVADLQQQLAAPSPERSAAQGVWEQAVRSEAATSWTLLHPEQVTSEKGVQFKVEQDVVFADRPPQTGADVYKITLKTKLKQITGLQLDVLNHPALPQQGPGLADNGNFVLTEVTVTDAAGQPVKLSQASATFEQAAFPAAAAIDGKLEANNGWAAPGMLGSELGIRFELEAPFGTEEESTLVLTLQQMQGANHTLGRFRLWATTANKPLTPVRAVTPAADLLQIVQIDAPQRNAEQQAKLAAYYNSVAPALADLRLKRFDAQRALTDYENSLPRSMIARSGNPRIVRILPRGNFLDETGEVVLPALPKYLAVNYQPVAAVANAAPAPSPQRLTRLDLAQWLVARDNPLTARVFVNRLWKQFFGIGLSKSLDDLGAQGEWPANPELLDWLAAEFVDSGWDVKHLVQTIVNSGTYRQSSATTPELQEKDPFNRELARQSRFRLDAEFVRDNALSISGLLVEKIGGPSVKPYQPDGYWENLNFPARNYDADRGPDQYRRGMYTWWQRTFAHPSMLAFDAPSREECAADRNRSNIPQQALVLLNDPSYVEAARSFAVRILKEGGADADSRLTWAWRQALSRPPRDDERATIKPLLERQLAQYREDAAAATGLLKVGIAPAPEGIDPVELAAWTNAARVLLNLHEVITRN